MRFVGAACVLLMLMLGSACKADTVPPCLTEDSSGPCYWDADVQGNGTGRSFYVDEHDRITYAP